MDAKVHLSATPYKEFFLKILKIFDKTRGRSYMICEQPLNYIYYAERKI